MNKTIAITGSIFILLGIIFGAFAAHGLEGKISTENLVVFEKGVRYQMYMGFGFLILGLNANKIILPLRSVYLTGLIGTIIFSGFIYLYSITSTKVFGAIIPIGGTLMILSWLLLIIKLAKQKSV